MSKRPLPPIGFWSYARPDDELSGGQLSRLRSLIRAELQQQYGREQIQLFQDISAISHGSRWEGEIRRALENSTFFIPIISPNFLQSEWCIQEVEIFRERQERLFDEYPDLPRTSRIFPVHYIDTQGIDSLRPEVDRYLAELQWFDFRDFRHQDFGTGEVRRTVSGFVTSVRDLLRVQVEQPDEVQPPAATPRPAKISAQPATPDLSPIPTPDEGSSSKLPLLIGSGIAALLLIAALLYFLVIRSSPDTPVAASGAAQEAVAGLDTDPKEAAAAREADGVSAELLAGRWGDSPSCTGRIWTMNPDGSHAEDGVSGGWAITDGILTVTAGGAAMDMNLELTGAEAQGMTLTPVDPTDGGPQNWYRCLGG